MSEGTRKITDISNDSLSIILERIEELHKVMQATNKHILSFSERLDAHENTLIEHSRIIEEMRKEHEEELISINSLDEAVAAKIREDRKKRRLSDASSFRVIVGGGKK